MNDEYNSLIQQKQNTQREYNACLGRIEECEYRLSRLKPAKKIIAAKKGEFKSLKKEDKNIVNGKYSWEGNNYDRFSYKGDSMLDEDQTFYKGTLDHILDSINNEITRLENQIHNEHGLLGRLASLINSLTNKIENFFN